MSSPSGHLVVIDLQHVFGDPASGWFAPRFGEIVDPIRTLVAAFDPAVTFTRFIAPATPAGAWQEYYRRWPWALQAADATLYRLIEPYEQRPSIAAGTFGKWGDELASRVGGEMVVAGVSTDCCVISTVLAAADAGVAVRVVTDACAGASEQSHAQALAVMGLYDPLVELTTVEQVLAQ